MLIKLFFIKEIINQANLKTWDSEEKRLMNVGIEGCKNIQGHEEFFHPFAQLYTFYIFNFKLLSFLKKWFIFCYNTEQTTGIMKYFPKSH